jgi:hypothetical protein
VVNRQGAKDTKIVGCEHRSAVDLASAAVGWPSLASTQIRFEAAQSQAFGGRSPP